MTETTKKCWSCAATTPYDVGWCDSCMAEIPADIQIAVYGAETEPFAGRIRMAVAEALQITRNKAHKIHGIVEGRSTGHLLDKINLDDLEI